MKKLILVFVTTSLLFSCKKQDDDKDTEAPVVNTVTINNGASKYTLKAGEEVEVSLDSTVTLQVNVRDNEALSQLKVEVHSAFDDHGHDDHDHRPSEEEHPVYSFNKVYTLGGNSQTISAEFWNKDKDNEFEGGDYHIELILLDKEGNQTTKVYTIELEEEEHSER